MMTPGKEGGKDFQEWVSQKEFAAIQGCSAVNISKLRASGTLPGDWWKKEKNQVLIHVKKAQAALGSNLDQTRNPTYHDGEKKRKPEGGGGGDKVDLNLERALTQKVIREERELNLKRKKNLLLDRDEVVRVVTTGLRTVRIHIESQEVRLAALLAEGDTEKARRFRELIRADSAGLLDDVIRALREMYDGDGDDIESVLGVRGCGRDADGADSGSGDDGFGVGGPVSLHVHPNDGDAGEMADEQGAVHEGGA